MGRKRKATKVIKSKKKPDQDENEACMEDEIDEDYWDAAQAAACDGITIKKEWEIPGKRGQTKFYSGKVTFMGEVERPYCFEVKYVDDKETMCLHEVLMLQKNTSASKKKAAKSSSQSLPLPAAESNGHADVRVEKHKPIFVDEHGDEDEIEDKDEDEGIFGLLESSVPSNPLTFGVNHPGGEGGDTFVICFGSWVEGLQKWRNNEDLNQLTSRSVTRIAKGGQWLTLDWLEMVMAAWEAEVNQGDDPGPGPGPGQGQGHSQLGRPLLGRIRIIRSEEDLSSYIVKTEKVTRCNILHGSLLSTLLLGKVGAQVGAQTLFASLPPPPFDLSCNTFPSWVVALAPDSLWPRSSVDFGASMVLVKPRENAEEGNEEQAFTSVGLRTQSREIEAQVAVQRDSRRERSAPQKKLKAK